MVIRSGKRRCQILLCWAFWLIELIQILPLFFAGYSLVCVLFIFYQNGCKNPRKRRPRGQYGEDIEEMHLRELEVDGGHYYNPEIAYDSPRHLERA